MELESPPNRRCSSVQVRGRIILNWYVPPFITAVPPLSYGHTSLLLPFRMYCFWSSCLPVYYHPCVVSSQCTVIPLYCLPSIGVSSQFSDFPVWCLPNISSPQLPSSQCLCLLVYSSSVPSSEYTVLSMYCPRCVPSSEYTVSQCTVLPVLCILIVLSSFLSRCGGKRSWTGSRWTCLLTKT